ncbi:MAG: hypothetical protein LCH71_02620 [Proteobacteria bacterium]|nr:hypothetical protein [Pseudomonadota bacterium]
MTQSEIRDRLLELARVRLKARFGAFEQFRFTLDGLPAGAAILTRAALMPAPWTVGLSLGLDEAAKQIDAHLLRLIDEWAQQEAPARQIPVLEGLQPLAAEPQAKADRAVTMIADEANCTTRRTRRDLLAPVIEAAQKECANPFDAPAVWAALAQMAEARKRPLAGVTDDGIKWFDTNDDPQFLTQKNLGERLRRMKRRAP